MSHKKLSNLRKAELRQTLRRFDFESNSPEFTKQSLTREVIELIATQSYEALAEWMTVVKSAHDAQNNTSRFTWFIRVFQAILNAHCPVRPRDWRTRENEALAWVERGFSNQSKTAESIALSGGFYRLAHAVCGDTFSLPIEVVSNQINKSKPEHCIDSLLDYYGEHASSPNILQSTLPLLMQLLDRLSNDDILHNTPCGRLFEIALTTHLKNHTEHQHNTLEFLQRMHNIVFELHLRDLHTALGATLQIFRTHCTHEWCDTLFSEQSFVRNSKRMFFDVVFRGWLHPKSSFHANNPSVFSALPLQSCRSFADLSLAMGRMDMFEQNILAFPNLPYDAPLVLSKIQERRLPLTFQQREFSANIKSTPRLFKPDFPAINSQLSSFVPRLEQFVLRQQSLLHSDCPQRIRRTSAL